MNKIIIVDTMVWSFLYDKNRYFGDAEQIFERFRQEGFVFAINSVIKHEFLRGRIQRYKEYFKRVIDFADNIEVDDEVFMKAVEIYRIQQIMMNRFERAPGKFLGDVLISATAFLKACYILTANLKDFCTPLFSIKNTDVLMKKGKGNFKNSLTKIETVYLLEPNYDFLEKVIRKTV